MKSRSGIQVMAGLIGMIRPLLSKMCLAVLMGCVGNLMATFITVLGAYGLTTLLGLTGGLKLSVIFTLLVVFSVLLLWYTVLMVKAYNVQRTKH